VTPQPFFSPKRDTWSDNGIDIQINNILFFSHGAKSNTHTKGATFFEQRCHNTWSFNGDGSRSFQINHILARREELKQFTNCDTIGGVKSDHTTFAAIIKIAKFIPKKQKQSHQQAKPPEGNQTKKEQNKRVPVDWEAIKQNREYVDKFNEKLDRLIDEDLKHIHQTWDPTMNCPYKRLLISIKEAARRVSLSDGKKERPPWFEKSKETIMQAI
jgi:hypothetical protein